MVFNTSPLFQGHVLLKLFELLLYLLLFFVHQTSIMKGVLNVLASRSFLQAYIAVILVSVLLVAMLTSCSTPIKKTDEVILDIDDAAEIEIGKNQSEKKHSDANIDEDVTLEKHEFFLEDNIKQKLHSLKNTANHLATYKDVEKAKTLLKEIEELLKKEQALSKELVKKIQEDMAYARQQISSILKVLEAKDKVLYVEKLVITDLVEIQELGIAFNQALNAVEELPQNQYNQFSDRLADLKIKVANKMVELAGQSFLENDIIATENFIMDLPSDIKEKFVKELDTIRIHHAERLVKEAEEQQTKDSVVEAKKSISFLKDGAVKESLEERLGLIYKKVAVTICDTPPLPPDIGFDGSNIVIEAVERDNVHDVEKTITDNFETNLYETLFSGDWSRNNQISYSGAFSFISKAISHDETSTSSVDFFVPKGATGKLSFWYFVSSEENADWFNVYVNGKRILRASGEKDWSLYERDLLPGDYTITFEYKKNESVFSGLDAAFIDDFCITIRETDYLFYCDIEKTEYRLDHEDWMVYQKPIKLETLKDVDKITARVIDSAGNISPEKTIYINDILDNEI